MYIWQQTINLKYTTINPRLGFVIVNDSKRGCGYGKKMIKLSIDYAFTIAGAEKLTIGVFENNLPAYHCYKTTGFIEALAERIECEVFGEKWKIIELEITRAQYFSNK